MTRVTETVLNVKQEISDFAAPKNHTHSEYLKNTETVTYLTNEHSDTVATNNTLGHVIVDTTVKDSENPVSNSAVKAYVDEIPKITLDNTVTENSTHGVTSKAVFTAINNAKQDMSTAGLSTSNPKEETVESFNDIKTPGIYKMTTNVSMPNKPDIDTKNSILTVLKMSDNITHILNLPNGNEYRRNGTIINNNITWDSWKLSYMPFQKYTAPLSDATYNNDVHDIEIFQDTSGYTIRWDQTYNPIGNNQVYFTTHLTQHEYKHVVKFNKNLDIVGPYVFSNIVASIDVKIQPDGIYLRSTKTNHQVHGINETYFIPRVP